MTVETVDDPPIPASKHSEPLNAPGADQLFNRQSTIDGRKNLVSSQISLATSRGHAAKTTDSQVSVHEEETEETDDDLLDKVIAKCVKSRFLLKAVIELGEEEIDEDDPDDDDLENAYGKMLSDVPDEFLKMINKIDLDFGYDKVDDKDKMDFINNLPPKDRKSLLDTFK